MSGSDAVPADFSLTKVGGDYSLKPGGGRTASGEEDPTPAYLRNESFLTFANQIRPGLYLSGFEASLMYGEMKKYGITHILVAAAHPEMRYPQDFIYKRLPVFDAKDEDLLSLFETCIDFINEGRVKGSVLVHCMAGVSRSATIVTAWLMKEHNWGAEEALLKLKKKRPVVNPNESFVWQLHQWAAMQYKLQGSTPAHKQYRQWKKRTEDTRSNMRKRHELLQQSIMSPQPTPSSNEEESSEPSSCTLQ